MHQRDRNRLALQVVGADVQAHHLLVAAEVARPRHPLPVDHHVVAQRAVVHPLQPLGGAPQGRNLPHPSRLSGQLAAAVFRRLEVDLPIALREKEFVAGNAIAADLRPVDGRVVDQVVHHVDVAARQFHPVAVTVVGMRAGVVVERAPDRGGRVAARGGQVGRTRQRRLPVLDEVAEPVLMSEAADTVHHQHLAAGQQAGVDAPDDRPVSRGVGPVPGPAAVAGEGLQAGSCGIVVATDVQHQGAVRHLHQVALGAEQAAVVHHRDRFRPGAPGVLGAVQHLRIVLARGAEVAAGEEQRAVADLPQVEAGGEAAGPLGPAPGAAVVAAAIQPRLAQRAAVRVEGPVPRQAAVGIPALGRTGDRLGPVPVRRQQQRTVEQADDRAAHEVAARRPIHEGVHDDRLRPGGALVVADAHHGAGHRAPAVAVRLRVAAHQVAVGGHADAWPGLVVAVVARNGETLHSGAPRAP